MKISVIIPVYNGEKYIKVSIESVLNQPYKDIEVIVMNDGSEDQSLKIAENIAEKDQRVRIINQENQGVAAARNLGIYKAKGEFIAFLDQDDIWVPDFLSENLINQIANCRCDMISFGYYCSDQNMTRVASFPRDSREIDEPWNYIGENYRHFSSYFYKKNFLLNEDLHFDRYRHEDERFRAQCFDRAKSMRYMNKANFVYRNNQGSVTHQSSDKKEQTIENCIDGYLGLMERLETGSRLYRYCSDTVLHLLLELFMEAAAKYEVFDFVEIEKKYHLQKFWNTRGWMSRTDEVSWNLYMNRREKFILRYKIRGRSLSILNLFKRIGFLRILYERRKYPLKWKKVIEYEKDKSIIFDS